MCKKVCNNCKQEKTYEHFSKKAASKDGYNSICKACFNKKYNKNQYQKYKAVYGNENGFKKPKYERDRLLKQIAEIREREADPLRRSRANYGFLFTNEKFWR